MTRRQGLYVALVGLVIAVLCTAALLVHRFLGEPASEPIIVAVVLLDVGLLVGLIVMLVGLVVAGIATFARGGGR